MIATRQPKTFSLDEYIELERRSDTKNEFVDGVIYAMVGATPRHVDISANILTFLRVALKGKRCRAYGSDLHLYMPQAKLGTYADVSVFCSKLEFVPGRTDIATNPTLVIEVLSPSTRDYDLGFKRDAYKSNPSVKEVLVVAQDETWVELMTRQPGELWARRAFTDMAGSIHLASIDVDMPFAEIYDVTEPG